MGPQVLHFKTSGPPADTYDFPRLRLPSLHILMPSECEAICICTLFAFLCNEQVLQILYVMDYISFWRENA